MRFQKSIATFSFFILLFVAVKGKSQAVLNANGPGNTYELINSILAPGNTSIEAPDQCASHPSFGRHVAEVFDAILNQFVFEFYMHVPTTFPVIASTADNDRCTSFDRQRIEIKTYEPSPDSLKGTFGETVTYKWMFRLPTGFQPSPNFTHIHQIKAVGGDDDDPLFTLTPRAGSSSNSMQLLYVDASVNSATTLQSVNLNLFLGQWVEVTEQIRVGASGTFSISIKRVSDGATLLNYSNSNMLTIRSDNSFIRPKWGIYRSLLSPSFLRDDSIRIANISIFEGLPPVAPSNTTAVPFSTNQINLTWVDNSTNETSFVVESSLDGSNGWTNIFSSTRNITSFSNIGLLPNTLYFYRVRAENPAGVSNYSSVVSARTLQALPVNLIAFNAQSVNKKVQLFWQVSTELNFKQYIIEWSKDGINFLQLATMLARGTGANTTSYSYEHINPIEANNFYRLKLVDENGSFQYSPMRLISRIKKADVFIYPNPAKNMVNIQYNTNNQNATVSIMDAVGKIVKQQLLNNNSTAINISELANGIYTISVIQNSIVINNQKLIVTNK